MSRPFRPKTERNTYSASAARTPPNYYRRRPCESQPLSAGDFCTHFQKSKMVFDMVSILRSRTKERTYCA
nr:MAG TPA: hypothetical protein [Caudoviricetes sp.]